MSPISHRYLMLEHNPAQLADGVEAVLHVLLHLY